MKQNINEVMMKQRQQWTVEQIEKQSERGGVNRQQVLFLIDTINRLEQAVKHAMHETERWKSYWFELNEEYREEVDELRKAIIDHRDTHMETLYPENRLQANHKLWSFVYPEEDEV